MKADNTRVQSDNLGAIALVFPHIFLPQLLTLLVVIAVAALKPFIHQSYNFILPDLSFSLIILCFLVAVGLTVFFSIVQMFASQLTPKVLSLEQLFFCALIISGLHLSSIESPIIFIVPVGISIIVMSWFVGETRHLPVLLIPTASLLFFLLQFDLLRAEKFFSLTTLGLYLLCNFAGVLLCKLKTSKLSSLWTPIVSQESRKELNKAPYQILVDIQLESFAQEYSWKIAPVCIAFVATGLSLGLMSPGTSAIQVAVWLSASIMLIMIGVYSSWQRHIFGLQLSWLIAQCVILCVWLNSYWFSNAPIAVLGYFMLVLLYGATPWSWYFNLSQALVYGLIALLISFGPSGNPYLLPGSLTLIVISLFLSARNYSRISSAGLVRALPKLMREQQAGVLAKALGEAVRLNLDSEECLIIGAEDDFILMGSKRDVLLDPRDKSHLAALRTLIKSNHEPSGLLTIKELDKQLYPLIVDCLGHLPRRCIYFRVQLKEDGDRGLFVGVIALNNTMTLIGLDQINHNIRLLLSLLEILSDSARRVVTTQSFGAAVKEVAEKDEEINEVIHGVNNAAQEFTSIREALDQAALQISKLKVISGEEETLQKYVSGLRSELTSLEGASTALAAGVSDTKWLGEAGQTRKVSKLERIPIGDTIDELVRFIDFRLRRSGVKFDRPTLRVDKLTVMAVNREFLEASLRTIARVLTRVGSPKDCFRFEVVKKELSLQISLGCSSADYKTIEDLFPTARDKKNLKSIINFLEFSKGQILFSRGDTSSGGSAIIIELILAPIESTSQSKQEGWIMLVDDKPEILSFYASVAQALELPFGCARDLTEARTLLRERGQPILLVTDIQLDQENGLDLVKEFRTLFGEKPSVIVVSGNVEENVKDQVFMSGASRYLTKPVGRRRLFLEIKELLQESIL